MPVLEPASVSAQQLQSVSQVVDLEVDDKSSDSPGQKTPLVVEMQEATQLSRSLMGGTQAMRDAGQGYLPRHPLETSEGWRARRDGSFLFGAFELAVESMVSRGFRRDIVAGEDTPEEVERWLRDVDREGNDVNVFAKDVLKWGIVNGVTAIVADSPNVPEGLNARQAEELNIRPYLTHVPLGSWRGVIVEEFFGALRFYQFWWTEWSEVRKGRFGVETVERVRVIRAGDPSLDPKDGPSSGGLVKTTEHFATVEVFERVEHKTVEATRVTWRRVMGPRELRPFVDLPLTLFFTERTGFASADPPMRNLADKNLEHWQSASDQRNILHVARVPLVFVSGSTADEVTELAVGPTTFYAAREPTARMRFVEHTGAAIEAGERDLKTLKEEMAILAMRPMIDRPTGRETATAKAIDTSQSDSRLQAWMIALESSLEGALGMAAQFAEVDVGEGIDLDANKDFGLSLATQENLRSLLVARAQGDVSRRTVLEVFHKVFRDVLSSEWSVDDELVRITKEDVGEETRISDSLLEELDRRRREQGSGEAGDADAEVTDAEVTAAE